MYKNSEEFNVLYNSVNPEFKKKLLLAFFNNKCDEETKK